MASSNARGASPEDSQIGDVFYRAAVISWVQQNLTPGLGFNMANRNNAVTIFNSEDFQIWLAKRVGEPFESVGARLQSQEYEALTGRIAREFGPVSALNSVMNQLVLALRGYTKYYDFIRDINGNNLSGKWNYSIDSKSVDNRWEATRAHVKGYGKTQAKARWNGLFNNYFVS